MNAIRIMAFSLFFMLLSMSLSAQVTLTSPAGASYQWYDLSTGAPVLLFGQTSQTFVTSMEGVYYCEYDSGLCTPERSHNFAVFKSGSASSDPVRIVSPLSTSTYQWYMGSIGSGIAMAGEMAQMLITTTEDTYYPEYDSGGGCMVYGQEVTVVMLPGNCIRLLGRG